MFIPARHGRLRRDLRASVGDGAAFGGMVGFGETYLPAFVLAVGLGELTAGLVASVPLVAGGVMQMISPAGIRRAGSYRRWVVGCAVLQALSFVPLFVAATLGAINGPAVLLIAAVYWAAGLATGPAWNTWIGAIVPPAIRARFFALRTRTSQATLFLGLIAGGIFLQLAETANRVLAAYALLFALAGGCRLVSAWLLSRQSEPPAMARRMRLVPWPVLLRDMGRAGGGRLLAYLVAVQAAVQFAGPYFTPFMLRELRLNYFEYVGLLSVAFLAKTLALTYWGRVAHRIGALRLLWIGGLGITPLGAGWLVSRDLGWLLVLQVVGGAVWAAYELAFFLLFFESIAEEERTSLLTFYNLLNTLAWVGGSLAGGAVLYFSGTSYDSYLWIFGLSSLGRCLALVLLARLPKMEVEADPMALRPVAVRPNSAGLDAPVLPSLPDQVSEHPVSGHHGAQHHGAQHHTSQRHGSQRHGSQRHGSQPEESASSGHR